MKFMNKLMVGVSCLIGLTAVSNVVAADKPVLLKCLFTMVHICQVQEAQQSIWQTTFKY